MKSEKVDMEQARLDPGSVFAAPEDILENPALKKAEKIDLLKRWKYDATELSESAAEGMVGKENNLLQRICLALEYLEQDG